MDLVVTPEAPMVAPGAPPANDTEEEDPVDPSQTDADDAGAAA